MKDNCEAEKQALNAVWPQSRHFLCHFHVDQQEWRWLCDGKNGVSIEKRRSCKKKFQAVSIKYRTGHKYGLTFFRFLKLLGPVG